MLLLALVLGLLLSLTDANQYSPLSASCWGVPRCGAVVEEQRTTVAVGLIRQYAGATKTEQSAIFYAGRDVYSSSGGEMEEDSIETLAITSDILLVVVDPKAPWNSSITESIVRGADRRLQGSYPKLGVLVVLAGDIPDDQAESWKERVLSERLGELVPSRVASLDIVVESKAGAAYQDIIQDLPQQGVVSDKGEYQLMIHQIYQALTSKSCDMSFEPAKASFFQASGATAESEGPPVDTAEPEGAVKQVEEVAVQDSSTESPTITQDVIIQQEREVEMEDVVATDATIESPASTDDANVGPESAAQQTIEAEVSQAKHKDKTAEAENALEEAEDTVLSEAELEEAKQALLSSTLEELERLEAQQDDVWLNPDSQVPLLHFGSAANAILEKASSSLPPGQARDEILNEVAGRLQDLYQSQLQSLREHFGRKYEAALEKHEPDDEQALAQDAAHITESFRAAAQHAIPEKCREGQELVDADFSYVAVMQGLITDMMEATSMQRDLDIIDDDIMDGDGTKKPATWYKKLAARAVMLGINYVQGWLAWQGVKKAAAQRDKDMPKFPLF